MSQTPPIPSIFIIGAQRCATSTLYGHLARHPEIFMSKIKEPRYFSHILEPPHFKGPGDEERVNKATIRDKDAYLSLFKEAKTHQACGEATTTYLGDTQALSSIAETVKHPKIIIILRNPLERAYSSYAYKRNQGLEPASSFEEALNDESRRIKENWAPIWHYASRSKYLNPTQEALSIFGESNVRVIRYETFVEEPLEVLNQLAVFLSLNEPFDFSQPIHYNNSGSLKQKNRLNKSITRVKAAIQRVFLKQSFIPTKRTCSTNDISGATALHLKSVFREDIQSLEKLLSWDLTDWLSV